MNTDQLLDVTSCAGKLLIESGAGIHRVEETMVRSCTSFSEAEDAQSFVTTTSIMFSITVISKTRTKILCVHTRGVDLNCIDKISSLSRETAVQNYTIEELALKLGEIENERRYSSWITIFFGALNAGDFAVFFDGDCLEAGCSFLIGLLIKAVSALVEQRGLHGFFTNAIAAASDMLTTLRAHALCPDTDVDILIISSIILLIPGLTIANTIRDTISGDYLSGVARATEVSLVTIAVTAGIGVVLSISIGLSGGM